jgi:signal transduction histidine kinase
MTDRFRALRAPWWRDVALVTVVIGIVIMGSIHIEAEAGAREIDALAVGCGITGALALLLWRRWPLVMAAVVATAMAVYLGRNYTGGPALLPGPLGLFLFAYRMPPRTAWAAAAGLTVVVTVAEASSGDGPDMGDFIVAGWAVAAVLAGQALRGRGERAAAERERQAHQAEQALANERLRIAQDLHDSVAHAMATINVQAGVAAHLLDRNPEQMRESLEAIRSASSDALDELSAILGVLRDRDRDGAAPLAPIAGIDRVDDLVERARADGLAVTVERHGDLTALSPSISTAAYRVVQEALTNVRRHAGDAATAVAIVAGADGALSVVVEDNGGGGGRPPPPATTGGNVGFGLVGMRERVESSGGTLRTGPASGGGFRVDAEWRGRR